MSFLGILVGAASIFFNTNDVPAKPLVGSCLENSPMFWHTVKIYSAYNQSNTAWVDIVFSNNYTIIENGTIEYTINLNGMPYYYTEPLCGENMECPIEKGVHILQSKSIKIPNIYGRLKVVIHIQSKKEADLMCMYADMGLSNGYIVGSDYYEDQMLTE